MRRKVFFLSNVLVDAVTGSEEMSKWEGAELTKSDRPDLSSAKIVVSGGIYISNFSFTHIHNQTGTFIFNPNYDTN